MRTRPLDCTARELAKFGVTVLDARRLWLCCDRCGRSWIPRNAGGARLPNGYWKCPNRCEPESVEPEAAPAICAARGDSADFDL